MQDTGRSVHYPNLGIRPCIQQSKQSGGFSTLPIVGRYFYGDPKYHNSRWVGELDA